MSKYNPFLITVVGMILLFSCGKKEHEQEIIRPVRYMQVFSTGGSRVRSFTGVAQAGVESRLSFKVPGTVKSVNVLVGDNVSRGQLIAELDPSDYELQVQQAEAALTQARAQERNASSNFERVRTLFESNNIAKSNYDAARAAYESAKAAVQATEKQLELARLQQSYTRLAAPVNGSIASVNVEVNENITAGQPIVMLTSGAKIEVKFSIPELLITQIKEGDKAMVSFDALPDKELSATVTEVGIAAISAGATYPVTVQLDKQENAIRPGMAATVAYRFESKDERERFIVPSHAVAEDQKGRFVFVVKPVQDETGFGMVHRKPVTIGELTADGIEIFEGLNDGDFVVTAGISQISDSLRVKM
jgi:multidrug efflux system membrane fusion protein